MASPASNMPHLPNFSSSISLHTAHLNYDGVVIGIDEETLDSLPKILYSKKVCQSFKSAEGNELDEAEDKKCCSICLSDYKESEVVRVMPDCTHMFHMNCIDEWLRLHATCPICRTSPLPSLRSTRLAQEAPPTTILTVHDHDSTRPLARESPPTTILTVHDHDSTRPFPI